MALSVSASRFACLPDDDSADWKGPKKQSNKKKDDAAKKPSDNKPKDPSKAKAQKEAKELQNLAFGGQKKKKKKGQQLSASSPPVKDTSPALGEEKAQVEDKGTEQLEEWREKDKVVTEDNFSQAIQEAILLSKLEFEQREAEIAAQARLIEDGGLTSEMLASLSKEERKRVVQKEKQKNTMSLNQFMNDQERQEPVAEPPVAPQIYKHPRHKDRQKERGDFFAQTDEAAVKALNREQLLETYRSQEIAGGESALVANYRELLVAKELELEQSKGDVTELKEKLVACKTRIKKLTEILMSGEMKEKTEVIIQVQNLEKMRDELTSSLSFTAGQLEQERSLVHQLELELKRLSGQEGVDQDVINRLLAIIIRAKKL